MKWLVAALGLLVLIIFALRPSGTVQVTPTTTEVASAKQETLGDPSRVRAGPHGREQGRLHRHGRSGARGDL